MTFVNDIYKPDEGKKLTSVNDINKPDEEKITSVNDINKPDEEKITSVNDINNPDKEKKDINKPDLGKKISKYFKGYGWFTGIINEIWTDNSETYFHIKYDDGDEEDLNNDEVILGLKKFSEHYILIKAQIQAIQ